MTGGPSSTRLEPVLNKTPPHVPSGVVIGVQFLPTLQTLKLITIPIILMRKPTLTVTASLTRISRRNIIHVDTVLFGLVFDVSLEFAERPLLELRGVRNALADVFQVLERNGRTVVLNRFSDKCF